MITAIKEGDHLKILSTTEDIPENTPIQFSLAQENTWESAQLETEFRSEEDWGDSLNDLAVK